MKSSYKLLGKYIREVKKRNLDLQVTDLLGLSTKKEFRPSISNIIGTDLGTYKIIGYNNFVYMPVTDTWKGLAVALYREKELKIVSQIYKVFEIIDENALNPEYLMMWFRRTEIDRYARFMSHGSAREIFDWDEMCNTLLPVPHIDKQREIVKEYNVIQNRIALNQQLVQKLEETAQAIYREWFVEGIDLENLPEGWRVGKVADLCEYSSQRISINEISFENYISTENMLQNRGGVVQANNLPATGSVTKYENGNILVSNIRPYFKKIWLANLNGGCSNDVLCFSPNKNVPPMYLYQILEKDNFFDYVMAGSKGTKMPRGDKKWIMNYETVIPSNNLLEKYSKTTQVFQKDIQIKKSENQKLTELKDLLLSKLATVA
jgi:type I restriction enzyme S subunit